MEDQTYIRIMPKSVARADYKAPRLGVFFKLLDVNPKP